MEVIPLTWLWTAERGNFDKFTAMYLDWCCEGGLHSAAGVKESRCWGSSRAGRMLGLDGFGYLKN